MVVSANSFAGTTMAGMEPSLESVIAIDVFPMLRFSLVQISFLASGSGLKSNNARHARVPGGCSMGPSQCRFVRCDDSQFISAAPPNSSFPKLHVLRPEPLPGA